VADEFLIEIDAETIRGPRSLTDALAPMLTDAGLPARFTIEHLGEPPVVERSLPGEVVGTASLVVNELRVHLPAAFIALGLNEAVRQTTARVKEWRRETGNAGIDVQILGPDGEVLAVVHRDRDIHTEFQEPPDESD
jgi:hypothetical protein